MADFPTYLRDTTAELTGEENYQEELNQTLIENFGLNGIVIPSVTTDGLTVTPILNPNTGLLTTVADFMPDGTVWYVIDHMTGLTLDPVFVGKKNGVLVQFSTTSFP